MHTAMHTTMVLNAKGGSGKTTLVTNIAGYYAAQNQTVVIKDYDPQGSSSDWLGERSYSLPTIHGLAAFKPSSQNMTRAWQMRLPKETQQVIIDTPAVIDLKRFVTTLKSVDKILIPVSASAVEVRATVKFIESWRAFIKLYPCDAKLGIVANRVNIDSSAYHAMCTVFKNLGMDVVASLSYNEKYLEAAESGVSVLELDHAQLAQDKFEWAPLINWLEGDNVMSSNIEEPKLYAIGD